MGLLLALQEEDAVRGEAQMRAGQWVSACLMICALIALARDAFLALSTLILATLVFAFFSLGRFGPAALKRVVHAATPALTLASPAIMITVIAKALDVETAFTTWLAPSIIAFLTTMSVLRLEPWRPIVYASVSSLLYIAAYAVTTWDMTWEQRESSVALVPYAQIIRVLFFLGCGIGLAVLTQALRTALERADRRARSRLLFGKYRLGATIASGGMATVVEANYCPEGGFERAVAIKRVHPHLARDPRTVELFRNEAELGARLAHPNIVAVLDFGRVDDTYFIAMEHVAGVDLKRLFAHLRRRGEPLPPAIAAFIACETLQGLGFAHGSARDRHGRLLRVVHRDLAPGNVLLSRAGEVKVADFGIAATLLDDAQHHTRRIVGNMAYLSPEQAAQRAFDHRADLFAVGVLLYEMLTLTRLFRRSTTAATLLAVLHDDPPDVPAWIANHRIWDRVFQKALAKNPEHRFANAREMSDAIVSMVGGAVAHADDVASFLARCGVLDVRHSAVDDISGNEALPVAPLPVDEAHEEHPLGVGIAGAQQRQPRATQRAQPTTAKAGLVDDEITVPGAKKRALARSHSTQPSIASGAVAVSSADVVGEASGGEASGGEASGNETDVQREASNFESREFDDADFEDIDTDVADRDTFLFTRKHGVA